MNEYLKHYTVELTTLAPVFIGSGEKAGKKEYVYDRVNKRIYMLNNQKMYGFLLQKHLQKRYENYLLRERKDLYIWMQDQGLRKKDYKDCISYELDCSDAEFNTKEKDIFLFVKDPYGNPYIPGSSLKGAIRTALLGSQMTLDERVQKLLRDIRINSRNRWRVAKKPINFAAKQLETEVFHTVRREDVYKSNAVCDEMTGLRIGDSRPLSIHDLTVCQKIDYHIVKKEKKMPLFRECLKPGVKVFFDLTIDTSICNYTVEDILNAIDIVFKKELVNYRKFAFMPEERNHTIFLGGGSGFISKTVEYDLYSPNEALEVVSNIMMMRAPKHKHEKDKGMGVSPHTLKLTKFAGKEYHMGICDIIIREADF